MSDSGFVFIEPNAHLSPAQCEEFFNRLNNEVADASKALEVARDREMDAKKIYTTEYNKRLLSDECPTVGRAKGNVTVAEREAWIHQFIDDERWIYETTKVQRENAESYVWALKDQIKIVQSLGVFSRLAYETTGRRHP